MPKGNTPLSDAQKETLEKNRKSWRPGQSGNPEGRPKGRQNRSTILRELLGLTLKKDGKAQPNPFDPDNEPSITIEKGIEIVLVQKALKGDLNAIKEIKDSIHGKLTEKTELSGPDGGAIPVNADVTAKVLSKLPTAELEDILNGLTNNG